MRLETPRLVLTPISVADAAEMSSVLAAPSLYTFTGGGPDTEAGLAIRFARWSAGATKPGQRWLNLVVRDRTTGVAMGYVQATVNPSSADIGWVIGEPWQRRGFATEAVGALMVHLADLPLRALIRDDHAASQSLAEKLGFARTPDVVRGERVWRK